MSYININPLIQEDLNKLPPRYAETFRRVNEYIDTNPEKVTVQDVRELLDGIKKILPYVQ